jgi:2-succinyl-6-hydroxy-2,4-cyclohexadiene-1-carboxylate synthase
MTTPAPTTPLHAAFRGPARGPGGRLVLAHGFTQSGRVWGTLPDLLVDGRQLVLVDLPGHGASDAIRVDVAEGALLVGDVGGQADYLGYSMGARYCLQLALRRPDLIRRLVLISGTAGIDGVDARAERRRVDEQLADRLDPADGSPAVDTVATFVDRWVANPLFGAVPDDVNGLDERKRNTASGLASSLRLAGTGTQLPVWDRLGELDIPVLVVTGCRDAKFTGLGHRLVDAIGPGARIEVVDGADHAPHLQQPGRVAAAVRHFLAD